MLHPSRVNLPQPQDPPAGRWGGGSPRVLLTWILIGVAVAMLAGKGVVDSLAGRGSFVDLALSVALVGVVSSAVLNARVSGVEGERRHSESESFSRIMRALSRSVSPDAVVEAIVHELGAATEADHVSVALLRPGGSVLDVTFVSMLPGAPLLHRHAAAPARADRGAASSRLSTTTAERQPDPPR